MKKTLTIITDTEEPVEHLLNDINYDIYKAMGNENVFTMVKKDNGPASAIKNNEQPS